MRTKLSGRTTKNVLLDYESGWLDGMRSNMSRARTTKRERAG